MKLSRILFRFMVITCSVTSLLFVAHWYNKESRACATSEPLGKAIVGSILRSHAANRVETGDFMSSIERYYEIFPIRRDLADFPSGSWSIYDSKISADNYGDYATASLFLNIRNIEQSKSYLSFYTGAVFYEASHYYRLS